MIYYVEDDDNIRELVVYTLNQVGLEARGFSCARDFYGAMEQQTPDLVLLDIMLPEEDGLTILRKLRADAAGEEIPVVMITAKGTESDKVQGLDLGADDYLIKPFAFDELLARIRALTRKRAGNRKNQFSIDDLVVDIERRTVHRGGMEIPLLPKEFTLLEYMIRNQGIVLSRSQMENQIWNYEYSGSSNNIDAYISRLRKKIDGEDRKKLIHTIRGSGWVLRVEQEGDAP